MTLNLFIIAVIKSVHKHLTLKTVSILKYLDLGSRLLNINPIERDLLFEIYDMTLNRPTVLVGDITGCKKFGSQSTLHHRLHSLKNSNCIRISNLSKDERKKCIRLTSKSLRYLEGFGRLVS